MEQGQSQEIDPQSSLVRGRTDRGESVVDEGLVPPAALIGGNVVGELASQRTELSFEQAAMSSDSALLAAVRTSMAMIAFGFIIFEFLQKASERYLDGMPAHSPRRFALALIVLGVALLCL